MLNSKVSLLSKVLFLSLLFMMQWFTTEEKWWSGALVFFILSFYLAPKAISKYQDQFIDSVKLNSKAKAIKSSLKMWFWAQGCFLGLAFIYYLVMAIGVAFSKMSIHLDGFGVAGVYWLTKLVGLLLSNVLFVPVIYISAIVILSQSISTANKALKSDS